MIGRALSAARALAASVRAHRTLRLFCLALFVVDLFWIGYFVFARARYELGYGPSYYFRKQLLLTTEGGLPEWFGYAQAGLVVALLVVALRRTRQPIYLALGVIFLIVLLDDALQLHETAGIWLSEELGLPKLFGLRRRDSGEAIAYGILALITLPLLAYGFVRSRPAHRDHGLAFMLPLGGLAFFAVAVDLVYRAIEDLFELAGVLIDALEDGGELLMITTSCLLALGILQRYGSPAVRADRTSP